jgi:hypothetical protein
MSFELVLTLIFLCILAWSVWRIDIIDDGGYAELEKENDDK